MYTLLSLPFPHSSIRFPHPTQLARSTRRFHRALFPQRRPATRPSRQRRHSQSSTFPPRQRRRRSWNRTPIHIYPPISTGIPPTRRSEIQFPFIIQIDIRHALRMAVAMRRPKVSPNTRSRTSLLGYLGLRIMPEWSAGAGHGGAAQGAGELGPA